VVSKKLLSNVAHDFKATTTWIRFIFFSYKMFRCFINV
jgi:hypothetical protein